MQKIVLTNEQTQALENALINAKEIELYDANMRRVGSFGMKQLEKQSFGRGIVLNKKIYFKFTQVFKLDIKEKMSV